MTKINNKGVISIAVVIGILAGVLVLGFGGYKTVNHFQTTGLIKQAEELETNEKYEEAIELLEKAKIKASADDLKKKINDKLNENEQLILDRDNYYQGVKKAESGDWQGAMELWAKISENSIYSKKVKTENEISVKKPSGENVHLTNYNHAKDPTWAELIAFLEEDNTDDNPYKEDSFNCTNFAEMLHNNAEKAGIKAAFVTIDFAEPPGHALNAFNTTDKGLVYIDNTGEGFSEMRQDSFGKDEIKCERDKVIYASENKEIGAISTDYPSIDPTSYQFYEDYLKLWTEVEANLRQYNKEVTDYNQKAKQYENKVKTLEKDQQAYDKLLDDYNQKLEAISAELDQKYDSKFAEINNKKENLNAWLNNERAIINNKIEELNKKYENGEIDWEQYNQEWDKLKKEDDENTQQYNQEWNKLEEEQRRLKNDMNNEIQQEEEKLKPLKTEIDNKYAVLKKQISDLQYEKNTLDNMSKRLDSALYALRKRERSLNTCRWISLGTVKKIEIFW